MTLDDVVESNSGWLIQATKTLASHRGLYAEELNQFVEETGQVHWMYDPESYEYHGPCGDSGPIHCEAEGFSDTVAEAHLAIIEAHKSSSSVAKGEQVSSTSKYFNLITETFKRARKVGK